MISFMACSSSGVLSVAVVSYFLYLVEVQRDSLEHYSGLSYIDGFDHFISLLDKK